MHDRRPGTAGNAARAGAGRIGLFGRRRAAPADANADPRLLELESWYRGVRPWLLPREEDCTLIVPPSSVYKLSGSAFPLMNWLDSGRSLGEIPGLDRAKIADVEVFFDQLQAAYEGRAPRLSQGFGRTPYDFAFTSLPVLGELAVTYRCNERCAFCYAGCGEASCGGAGDTGAASEPGGEMTLPGAKRIIDIFRHEAKIPFFSFTGGEPLLRDDLEAMAEYAHSLGLRTNLITNGTLATPRRAASLYAAGLRTAQVSLESPDPDTHDGLCGVPGAWERTVAGIHALREAGFSVQTNSTLTAINSESLERLPGFLASIGVRRFSMNLFIPSGRGRSSGQLAVRYTDTGPFVEATSRRARAAGLDFFWYSPTPYCLFNPVAKGLGNKSCAAMDGLLHVDPAGNVLPCSSWPEPMGNLLTEPFTDIWFAARAGRFKRKEYAPIACSGCDSFVACQGACPLYFAVMGESELADAARSRPASSGTPGNRGCGNGR